MNNTITPPSKGYRFLTGLAGGLLVLVVLQVMLILLSPKMNAVAALLLAGGQFAAFWAPFRFAFFFDATGETAEAAIRRLP